MLTTAAPDAAQVARVVDWIRLIPSALRDWAVTSRGAQFDYGIEPALLEQLLDAGLPGEHRDGALRFDARDLGNAALHLGLRSVQRRAMESWRKTLELTAALPAATYGLEYTVRGIADDDEASLRVLVPPGQYIDWRAGAASETFELCRGTRCPDLPITAEVCAQIADLRFFSVPSPLREDIGFARESRLAGCGAAAALILDACATLGVEARGSYGLLLSQPYSTRHVWTEVRAGGEWVAFDPHLLQTLSRHAGLHAEAWPSTRSPGCVLARLHEREVPLAVRGDRLTDAQVTVRTRLSDADR